MAASRPHIYLYASIDKSEAPAIESITESKTMRGFISFSSLLAAHPRKVNRGPLAKP